MIAIILQDFISNFYSLGIDAVIFDCDGVLVDTEHLKFLAWQEALATQNIAFTLEEYQPLIGNRSKDILHKLSSLKGVEISEEVIEIKNKKYHALQKQGVPPIKEMVAFAKELAREKQGLRIKLGVASSAPAKEILQNLEQMGLDTSFDVVISGSSDLDHYIDEEGKNKPKPYIYLEAAKRLNVLPCKCLAFEDTSSGIEAAVSAGMIAIALPHPLTRDQDFSKAHHVIFP